MTALEKTWFCPGTGPDQPPLWHAGAGNPLSRHKGWPASVPSYNGWQTLLKLEGGRGGNPPSGRVEDEVCILRDPILCSTLPGKAQWHHPCIPHPARPREISQSCSEEQKALGTAIEHNSEECFQAQAAVTAQAVGEGGGNSRGKQANF